MDMKNRIWRILPAVCLSIPLFWGHAALAVDKIQYTRLSGEKARFFIDGRYSYLKIGQTGPEGIKLLSVTKDLAIIEYDGKVYAYEKGRSQGKPLETEIQLERNASGMFFTKGSINGKPLDFMIDTGATGIVLNQRQAKSLKIDYVNGDQVVISTASKRNKAYMVTLDSVWVEGIVVNNVMAFVIKGKFPEVALLGNSFLHRLNMVQSGNLMLLQRK